MQIYDTICLMVINNNYNRISTSPPHLFGNHRVWGRYLSLYIRHVVRCHGYIVLHSLYAAQGIPVYACVAWKHLFVVHTHNRQSLGFSSTVLPASIRRKAPVSLSISSVDCTRGIIAALPSANECFCNTSSWSIGKTTTGYLSIGSKYNIS